MSRNLHGGSQAIRILAERGWVEDDPAALRARMRIACRVGLNLVGKAARKLEVEAAREPGSADKNVGATFLGYRSCCAILKSWRRSRRLVAADVRPRQILAQEAVPTRVGGYGFGVQSAEFLCGGVAPTSNH